VRRVGLSATVNPPEEAARHLTGGGPCAVLVPKIEKRTELTVDVPVPDMRQLPEHSVWPAIADRIIEALDHARTVLVFVDGRAGCERLALKINERAGQTLARTHHGCVSKEQRLEAERMLKSGELRVMVATSSMELGVDVGEIDLVVQVGPPPGVSALLQRLGRAGHNPGRVSRMRVYPRTAAEAIGCALVCEAAREGRIERVHAPEMCLDVLSQHLVSMAAAGAYTVDEAVEILSRAYAYRRLASEDVKAVLGMLSGDYERMDDRPVKPRVVYDRLSGRVSGDAYTRMLALSAGGTIPDRGWFAVTLADGTRLGELDEEFVFEARLGDKFYLGAFPWKIEEITRDRVIVSPTSPEGATSPFWKGDRAARVYETGAFYGSLLSQWEDAARRSPAALRATLCAAGVTPDAAENAARVLESQLRAVGCLATDRVLVAEHFSDEAGEHQLMLHSPFGDAVNRALGMLLARRAAAATGADARAYDDDDGALIYLVGGQPIPDGILPALAAASAPTICPAPLTPNAVPNTSSCEKPGAHITSTNPDTAPGANCASASANVTSGAQLTFDSPAAASGIRFTSINPDTVSDSRLASVTPDAASVPLCGAAAEVRAMLPASPMFSMAFRYNVQRALLNGVRGGRRQPLWVQRLRGAEALGAAAAHPEHPMMRETLNECADGYLDLNALARLLSAIRAGQVRVYEVHTDVPSPLCLNLRRQVEAEMMYDTAIPSAAVNLSKEALLTLSPTEEAVKSASRPARAPRSADELHARLLSEGDLLAGEADAPAEWMDALEIAGRAVYIEPGLWIARENEDEYRLALEENDAAALSRVVRRAARFHGAQTAETLSERYAVDEARAQEALNALCSEGILREFGGAYVHAELYESAQRMTVALNRQRVETQPARAFARMLSQRVRGAGSSAAQLAQALDSLRGCACPAAAWEGYLLPARVANYRPQLLDEALARGEAAYRVLPAERAQLPSETTHRVLPAERSQLSNEARTQAAARPHDAAPSCARVSIDGSQLPGEAVDRNEVDDRV
ncbi:MAG: helicase-related protein, partial [Clostridia bacterium]|nr:helicase-related protein [Clostridia bacterium]